MPNPGTTSPRVFAGDTLSRSERYARLLCDGVEAACCGSIALVRWVANRRRRKAAAGALPSVAVSVSHTGASPHSDDYADSTATRYLQVAHRFAQWVAIHGYGSLGPATLTRFLAEATGQATGSNRDPAHRGLGRTTLYALRATVDAAGELTAGLRPPPHPPPVAPPRRRTVAALWRAARDSRERLLVVLCHGVGLRPGQMAPLHWCDLDLRQRKVRYAGHRGQREAAIPRRWLRALVDARGDLAEGDHVFPPTVKDGIARSVSVRTLQSALSRLAQRAGAPAGTTFESLRRAASGGSSARGHSHPALPCPAASRVERRRRSGRAGGGRSGLASASHRFAGGVRPAPRSRPSCRTLPGRDSGSSACARRPVQAPSRELGDPASTPLPRQRLPAQRRRGQGAPPHHGSNDGSQLQRAPPSARCGPPGTAGYHSP